MEITFEIDSQNIYIGTNVKFELNQDPVEYMKKFLFENSQRLFAVNWFCKKAQSQLSVCVLNKPLTLVCKKKKQLRVISGQNRFYKTPCFCLTLGGKSNSPVIVHYHQPKCLYFVIVSLTITYFRLETSYHQCPKPHLPKLSKYQ